MSSLRFACLCLAVMVSAEGAEVVRRDLQLSLDATPTDFDYTITAPGGTFSGSDGFDSAWQTRVGGRWAFTRPGWSIAPVGGVDVQYRSASYAGGGGLDAYGLALTLGGAWAITDRWSTDLELALSYERASLDLGGSTPLSGSGTLLGNELRLRGVYQLNRTWLIGLEAGWQVTSGTIAADQGRDVDLDLGGYTAGLLVIWRGSMRPAGLE